MSNYHFMREHARARAIFLKKQISMEQIVILKYKCETIASFIHYATSYTL